MELDANVCAEEKLRAKIELNEWTIMKKNKKQIRIDYSYNSDGIAKNEHE